VTVGESFLRRVTGALEAAGVPYMLAGSLGSSLFGQARATNDADIVIAPTAEQLQEVVDSLGDYYVSAAAAEHALRIRSMFNVIDVASGSKADLILLKDRDFSREEFSRRTRATVMGVSVWIVTPEDAILSKLEWSKAGESERQFQDALGIALVQFDRLDWPYLRRWAVELNIQEGLDRLLTDVESARGGSGSSTDN
jgi:hypothetical protein